MAELIIGDPAPDIDLDRGEAFIRLTADELDSLNFPTAGYASLLEWTAARDSLGAKNDYDQITFALAKPEWVRCSACAKAVSNIRPAAS